MSKENPEVALRRLGDDVPSIHRELRKKGVDLGARNALSCPITQFLRKLGYTRALVSTDVAITVDAQGTIEAIDLPESIRAFINAWDKESRAEARALGRDETL